VGYRRITIQCEKPNEQAVEQVLANCKNILHDWQDCTSEKYNRYEMIVDKSEVQSVLDQFTMLVQHLPSAFISVEAITTLLPEPPIPEREEKLAFFGGLSREELVEEVDGAVNLNLNFLSLLGLSTVVAAIGLHVGDLAAVIGAMVIAPMLQSHVSFALGATLGNVPMMRKAAIVNIVALFLVLILSYLIGLFWPAPGEWSDVLLDRTQIHFSHLALAFAAGAAAVLSLTTGVGSALVGVMVAVALLPPLAAAGLLAGAGEWMMASGAFWLALANIICINLASKLVFQLKGISPRGGNEKKHARSALLFSYGIWAILLAGIILIIMYKGTGLP
jgi:uncharacterized hydrophobic protein (TIGR00341 family)